MIAMLSGVVVETAGSQIVLDVHGVGYGVLVTLNDLSHLALKQPTKLYIHETIREDSYDLYGFRKLDDKKLYEQLLSVKNVGPKVAMAVLDTGTADEVRVAIAGGDVKRLQSAKGVGKRAAEQMVVELKDKVGLAGVDLQSTGLLQGENLLLQDEAVEALVGLGYSAQEAGIALQHVDPGLPVEDRIKLALKG